MFPGKVRERAIGTDSTGWDLDHKVEHVFGIVIGKCAHRPMITHVMTDTPAGEPASRDSNSATPSAADATAPATGLPASPAEAPVDGGHGCAHCDSGEDHSHADEHDAVTAYRAALRGADSVRAVLAIGLLLLAVTASATGLLTGAGSWLVATIVGILALVLARLRIHTPRAVVLGSLISAAAMPLLALATSTIAGDGWAIGLAAGSGWIVLASCAELRRDRTLASTLIAHTRDGEAARQAVTFAAPTSPWVELTWSVLTGVLFGVWVWATGAVPLIVLTLVPLQVALAALSRRFTHGRG